MQSDVLDVVGEDDAGAREDGVDAAIGEFDGDVRAPVEEIGVVARAAHELVGTGTAVEHVVAGAAFEPVVERVTGDDVGERVAPADARSGRIDQHQVLDVVAQGPVCLRKDRVGPGIGGLDHHVERTVDVIAVVARATDHRVVAGTGVEHVVAGQAFEPVVAGAALDMIAAGVADADHVGIADEEQRFHIHRQDVRSRTAGVEAHQVVATVGGFGHGIGHGIEQVREEVGVVARAADERVDPFVPGQLVSARAAIEPVIAQAAAQRVAAIAAEQRVVAAGTHQAVVTGQARKRLVAASAGDDVAERIPGAADAGRDEGEVLEIRAEREGHRGSDQVVPRPHHLDHLVARVVDDVGVVADAAGHGIGPAPPVDRIGVQSVAGEDVVQRVAGQRARRGAGGAGSADRILDVGFERVVGIEREPHRVGSGVDRFDHRLARPGQQVGVVAGAAEELCRLEPTGEIEDVVGVGADRI